MTGKLSDISNIRCRLGGVTVGTCLSRGNLNASTQAELRFFDPGFLPGNQALNKLRPFLLVGLDTFVEEHLANLRQSSLLVVRYPLELALEFRSDPKG